MVWEEHATWTKDFASHLATAGATFEEVQPIAYSESNADVADAAMLSVGSARVVVPGASRLAAKQGWTLDQTRDAIEGYGQFVAALAAQLNSNSKGALVPSLVIDEVWHHHARQGKAYDEMIASVFDGHKVHHDPDLTTDDLDDKDVSYAATLDAVRLIASSVGTVTWPKDAPKVGCFTPPTEKSWSKDAPKLGCISSQAQDKAWSKNAPKVGCVCLPPYCDKTKQGKAWSENAPKVGCISSQEQDKAWSTEAPKVGCISSQTQDKAWSENAPKVGCISSQKQSAAWSKEAPKVGCVCLPPYCDKTKQGKAWSENAPKVGCISSQDQDKAWSKEAPKVGCISSQ